MLLEAKTYIAHEHMFEVIIIKAKLAFIIYFLCVNITDVLSLRSGPAVSTGKP